ncbi:MAG: T9SS type A sorting domain-containing protein [Calditrichaeota bacterium]|nr:T9SS type A sorting domain-containing protein [Calditrichota bacterium]
MRIAAIFLCTILLTFSVTGASPVTEDIRSSAAPLPLYDVDAQASFFVRDRGLNGITLEVVLPPTADRVSMQGVFSSSMDESSDSPLPYISRWVVIPENVDANLHIVSQEGRRLRTDPQIGSTTFIDDWDISITETENFQDITTVPAFVGNPSVLRGIRMVPVLIFPLQKLDDSGTVFENHEVTIELEFTPSENNSFQFSHRAPYSLEFSNVIENLVVNPPARDLSAENRSKILIVHTSRLSEDEAMMNDLNAFAEWKRRLGYAVELLPIEIDVAFEAQQENQEAVKEAIRERYEAPQSIEFLMIMGHYNVFAFGADSIDQLVETPYLFPTFYGEIENWERVDVQYQGDQFFVTFDEADNMPDVIVGRFMSTNYEELSYALHRVIQYEQNPIEGEWFTRSIFSAATSVVNGVAIPPSFLALDVAQWTERRLMELGYEGIFTVVDQEFPDIGDEVLPRLEAGVSLALSETWLCGAVTYETIFDEDSVQSFQRGPIANTGRRHPFVITNHSHYHNPILEPFFNSGSVDEPSGPVSAFGMWLYPYNLHLSHIIGWSVWGMQNLPTMTSGYLFQYTGMQLNPIIDFSLIDEATRWQFKGFYQFLGDPTVQIRNAQPTQLTVNHPESFNIGATLVNLTVTDGENPVGDAIVCIRQGEDLQYVEMSGPGGNVRFTVPDGLLEGELQITASKHNFIPYLESPAVEEQDINIVLDQFQLVDGELTNGQNIELELTFRNTGESDANELTATFSSNDDYLSFSANQIGVADIRAGQTGGLAGDLRLTLDHDCPGGTLIQVSVDVNSGDSHWLSAFEIATSGPNLVIEAANDQLVIGEERRLNPAIANIGNIASGELTAELVTSDPYVTVTVPNQSYQAIGADRSAEPEEQFTVSVDELFFPGSKIDFELLLSDGEEYNAVVPFQAGPVGEVSAGDPYGPDDFGYICFDSNDDEWEDHPVFNWIEISSDAVDADIPGTKIEFEFPERPEAWDVWNATEWVELPFTFKYYGRDYDTISICTDGWISMGADGVENRSPEDWRIPGPGGADAILNVYHTDLETSDPSLSGVYYHYLEEESKFIVEWYGHDFRGQTQLLQNLTFQVILYDPDVYTTPTGDGEIEFQYKIFGEMDALIEVNTPPSIGIRNYDGSDGLQYYYKFEFPPQAVQPENEFALKFTTAVQTGKGSASGRIVQMADPEIGVPGATIDLRRVDEILSDDEGLFRIENLREGLYTATINAPGYGRIDHEIIIVAGEDIDLDPILLPSPQPHVEVNPFATEVRPDTSRTRADVLLENRGTGLLEYSAKIGLPDGRLVDYRSISEFSINEIFELEGFSRAYAPLYIPEQDLLYIPVKNGDQKVIGVFNLNGELQRTIQQPLIDEYEEFRSLAWDGENLWGSVNSFNGGDGIRLLLKLDAEGAIVDTIEVPFEFFKSLPFVFSPGGETVYVTEAEEALLEMDRDGNVLQSWNIEFPARFTEITGMGYYPFDVDGMPLYLLETGEEFEGDTRLRYIKFNPDNGDWKVEYVIEAEDRNGELGLRTTYGATVIPPGYDGEFASMVVVQTYGRTREANDLLIEREISPNIGFMVPGTIQNMSGEVEPGRSVRLGFEVEGNGWPEGQYRWSYVINHNAIGDSIVVPVTLTLDLESGYESNKPNTPADFGLSAVYPNPFNNLTRITFGIDQSVFSTVNVYDLNGRLVETLFNGKPELGRYTISWDATDIVSGVYFLQLQSGDKIHSKKVVLLK